MSARHRSTAHRRRAAVSLLAVLAGVLAVAGLQVPGAYGGFIAKVTNNSNTAQANPYFTCAAAQGSNTTADYLTYPFGESSGLTAADISGNNRPGTYSSVGNQGTQPTGVTYGVANGGVCPRDNRTVITLNGVTGFVSGPTSAITAPSAFTIEIWFRTSSAQGKLIGFGNARNTLSTVYERHLYIDANGRLVFGVFPGSVQTLTSSATVTDGVWHHAVGTLSGAGMMLYLDGKQVASNTAVTTDEANTGYWRIGWDNLAGWTNAPSSSYFNGSLAFASVFNSALTATQIAQQYAAGR